MLPSHGLKTYPHPRLSKKPVTKFSGPVRAVRNRQRATGSSPAPCTTSETWYPDAATNCTLPIRNITAKRVASISVPTYPMSHRPAVIIPTASLPWRSAWSSKMGWRIAMPVGCSGGIIVFLSPSRPSKTGWRRGEKKASEKWDSDYLAWALADFSGYIAADELYDGPFCVLSIVDNQTFKRLFFEILDHAPTRDDVTAFFTHFRIVLEVRQLTLHGITTDGSSLYPTAIEAVWGTTVRHQLCEFHILKDLNAAILHAVAQVRKDLAAQQPKLGRGRPSGDKRQLVQKRQRLQQKIADLFDQRFLFVQRHLTENERATLHRITRGLPQLRAVREITDEIYRLFDRRCRTATALAKLVQVRQRVQRFAKLSQILKGLFSANVEKALTFLDDCLLGATSNAVERGNRRYRKMQQTVYRVRTYAHIVARMALDLFRDAAMQTRSAMLDRLHSERAAPSICR
jgi:hypothetical protein